MSRSKKRTDSETDEDDTQLTPKVEQLTNTVCHLADHVEVLRNVLDELRSEVVWAIRNGRPYNHSSSWLLRLNCMPDTPAPPSRPKRLKAANVNTVEAPAPTPNEEQRYCCPNPQLEWLGDPDFPSIQCSNCGYVVAEEGQLALHAASLPFDEEAGANRDDAAEAQGGAQQSLF